jgi:ABC-type multidrug transport system fused ATPase/permease subunit
MACNLFFAVEASLKFGSVNFSPRRYVQEPGNILWLSVLVISVVGFVLAYPERFPRSWIENLGTDETTIKQLGMALRNIDSLRMYRLMALLPTLDRILSETMDSLRSIINISVFLLLCTFCTAVCGIYLTGRSNFSSLFSALLTSFQIFTGDSWTSVLYDAMAAGQSPFWSYMNAAFVVVWLIFSIFVIGNLFISAIVTHIQVSQTLKDIEGPGYQNFVSTTLRANYREFIKWKDSKQLGRLMATMSMHNSDSNPPKSPKASLSPIRASEPSLDDAPAVFSELNKFPHHKWTERTNTIMKIVQDRFEGLESPCKKQLQNTHLHLYFEEPVLCGFSSTFLLRKYCIYFDQHPLFDGFIVLIVVASCIILVISPQYPDVPGAKPIITYHVSDVLNIVFTMCFLAEFIVRIMSRGFINTRNAYLSDGWNRLDFGILIFALIDISGLIPAANAGKVLRSARILSPLRVFAVRFQTSMKSKNMQSLHGSMRIRLFIQQPQPPPIWFSCHNPHLFGLMSFW